MTSSALQKTVLFIGLLALMASCGVSKSHRANRPRKNYRTSKTETTSQKAEKIVDYAKDYLGTRYQYGGTTKGGMDCSGLIYTAFFNAGQIKLPRTTHAMAKKGQQLAMKNVEVGDLLFFRTNKTGSKINHAGLVVNIKAGQIKFIHASTSNGVMISSMDEAYWQNAFVQARQIL